MLLLLVALLVIFKSRCVKISLCFGLWSYDREVQDQASDTDKPIEPIVPPEINGQRAIMLANGGHTRIGLRKPTSETF